MVAGGMADARGNALALLIPLYMMLSRRGALTFPRGGASWGAVVEFLGGSLVGLALTTWLFRVYRRRDGRRAPS